MENIYQKMPEPTAATDALPQSAQELDTPRYIPADVAHELNNIIAIIRGYADRLLVKHGQNPALEPQLKLISDAAKRAGLIVREAMPPKPNPSSRPHSSPPRPPAA